MSPISSVQVAFTTCILQVVALPPRVAHTRGALGHGRPAACDAGRGHYAHSAGTSQGSLFWQKAYVALRTIDAWHRKKAVKQFNFNCGRRTEWRGFSCFSSRAPAFSMVPCIARDWPAKVNSLSMSLGRKPNSTTQSSSRCPDKRNKLPHPDDDTCREAKSCE